MGFQSRARTPRDFGRRPGRSKSKTKPGKHETGGAYRLEEERTLTFTEIANRALNSLSRLGSQRFAVGPFYEHYDRWMLSVRNVLSEFEASSAAAVDDSFKEECSRVLSGIESTLNDRRVKEASNDDAVRKVNRNLLDTRSILAQTEREYAAKMSDIAAKREHALKPVATNLGRLRQELSRISRVRAGFLRGLSKKTKAQKEAEAAQKLESTRRELAKVEQSFAAEQARLRKDHSKKKQQILEQIATHQKELDDLEGGSDMDDAVEVRRAACDDLIASIDAFLKRAGTSSETTNSPA
jgi:DNA repair exonuclease SbcCD ATPase subunit